MRTQIGLLSIAGFLGLLMLAPMNRSDARAAGEEGASSGCRRAWAYARLRTGAMRPRGGCAARKVEDRMLQRRRPPAGALPPAEPSGMM